MVNLLSDRYMLEIGTDPVVCEGYNARIKHYPGFDHFTVFNTPAFAKKVSKKDVSSDDDSVPPKTPTNGGGMRSDSVHRAKTKVFDIAYLNQFSLFITLTFNGSIHSRTDADSILHTVRNYTRNLRKYDPSIAYLLIPEYHADKESIHLHGLFSASDRLGCVPSSHFFKDRPIYNLDSWRWGFSTAIPLDNNRLAVAKYITKYVTKDVHKIFGNIYLAGNVDRNVPEEYVYIPFSNFPGVQYDLVDGLAVKYREVYNVDQP